MTDYETAALEIRRAALEISHSGLWAAYAQAGVALFVGLVQAGLIYYGVQIMRRSADHRDDQHKETMTALEQQGEALRALIARTAPKD